MSKLTDAIRAKYPGAYDNVDDATLEKQVLAKYPQYATLQEPEPPAAPPEDKSVTGFLGNLLTSGGRFAVDTVKGLGHAAVEASPIGFARTLGDPQAALQRTAAIPGAIKDMVVDRYGSLEKAGNTLYRDPVGVLGDVASVASGGSVAAARAPRLARLVSRVERATNPVRVAEPIAKATEFGTAAAIRPLLAPARATIRQSRAPLEIERTALREGAVTQRGATAKLRAASGRTTKAAEDATAAGVTVPRDRVTHFPKTLKQTEELTPNIKELDDLAALESETVASLPANLTPSELLTRRRALDKAVNTAYRAEERGGYIRSTRDKGQKELGGNMREALREVAPGVRESDDLARRLGLVQQALSDANTRAKTIPMSAALASAGGGYFAGGPAAAALGASVGIGRTFPQIPLALGSLPVRGTAAAAAASANPAARQGLLLSALLERLRGQD